MKRPKILKHLPQIDNMDLMTAKELYLVCNPFKFSKQRLQENAEAISDFISFASNAIHYDND